LISVVQFIVLQHAIFAVYYRSSNPWKLEELKAKITAAVQNIAEEPLAVFMESNKSSINSNGSTASY
jgi:hypothetical protein